MANPMERFAGLFSKSSDRKFKDQVAKMLRTDPAALDAFEAAYRECALAPDAEPTGSLFDVDAAAIRRDMAETASGESAPDLDGIIARAVGELVADTSVLEVGRDGSTRFVSMPALPEGTPELSKEELMAVPPPIRPQAAGSILKMDLADSMPSLAVLTQYKMFQEARTPRRKAMAYNLFRQGLDILDLDPLLYAMLGKNPNAMSKWLPGIAAAAAKHGFFSIPRTRIARVPMPLLQLSRTEYRDLTRSTMAILDRWAWEVFGLEADKEYFVKTGTYSSKFDFRNAHVHGEKEVRELGEYLLYIQHQAVLMAGPLATPSIVGASTTNEWAVREYIADPDKCPTIYKGLPLRTEYRAFVDFDTRELLGIAPYWDPDLMKKRFSGMDDAASPHQRHDYVIYAMHEPELMARYEANKGRVAAEIAKLLPDAGLSGQWSIDVMQSGDEFWLIDMATADSSALSQCVPAGKLREYQVDWLPELPAGL